ncbi:unnamed protein product [Miscanthus lutarioriparius]|uniref:Uncharacterized protein n=1 Tax=Miscanthus lutarioriparius TaxID=422564 RepID=A0A811QJZ7_9POAL|nr:unnamed protein product [Miscanthus lutarioriparius]
MLPIAWDQWSNARLLEGKKVGVQVPRGEKDRSAFSRDGVASAVRLGMTEVESRRAFVGNAKKLQAIVSDRELQEEGYIDGFIQQLTSYKVN